MAVSDEYLAFLHEELQPLAQVTSRRMFGGAGLYAHGRMFALVADDCLYIKVDDANRSAFLAAGCAPFMFQPKQGPATAMSYYSVPESAIDAMDELINWCRLGIEAALRQPQKPNKKRATKKPAAKKEI